ncbi:MAG: T9SS type A sorting domain-containing protein [Bacteroidales bacterium]|nr:T9SS type A sorting domain-containing protein [Bacteroidales bacterium]
MKKTISRLSKLILFSTALCMASFVAKASEQTYTVTFFALGADGNEGTEFGTLAARLDDWEGELINSGDQVEEGRTVRFEADPKPGYRVQGWYRNGEVISNIIINWLYTLTSLTEDIEITVKFEEWTHQVTFGVESGKGKLIAKVDDQEIQSGNRVMNSKDIVFTAIPDHGYQVVRWFDGMFPTNTSDTIYTKNNIYSNVSVRVEFEKIPGFLFNYDVTFGVIGNNGILTATLDDEPITSGKEVEEGKEVVFTATPNAGYQVKGWVLNGKPLTVEELYYYQIQLNGDTWILTMEVEDDLDLKVEFEHKGEVLAKLIAAYDDGKTLEATFDLATSTVTVTSGEPVTNATSLTQYGLQIPESIIVRWAASFSTDANLGANPLVSISGDGTFEVVEGGLIRSTNGGAALQSFAGAGNIAIIINGGTVQAGDDNAAIQLFGSGNASVTVKAGKVLAKESEAIFVSDGVSVAVSGGLVFAYGEDIGDVIGIGFAGGTIATEDITGDGVIIAWDYTEDATYDRDSTTDITSLPEGCAVWGVDGDDHGIRYKNNVNEGFIVLPVTVEGSSANIRPNIGTQTGFLQVFPNPVNYELSIEVPNEVKDLHTIVELFDINGKRVYHGNRISVTGDRSPYIINISHLPEGTYIVRIGSHSAKVVKQ